MTETATSTADRHAGGEWPDEGVVTAALADPGWRPLAFDEYVLKIHGRCNLSCDYCYMYEMADQSWRDKPAVMSQPTLEQTVRRIAEHVERHAVSRVTVVFHGGEPLMVGTRYLERAARTVRAGLPAATTADLVVQTNAVLLAAPMLTVLRDNAISVGVSVDGGQQAHDRHRRYANGKGSHAAVMRGIARLTEPANRHLFSGVLCTIDVDNDPVAVYEDLVATGAPGMDLLLPHANWLSPPPGYRPGKTGTRYAEWLIAVFDRWYGASARQPGIRFFQEIMNLVLGGASASEAIGLSPVRTAVIDTDGSVEQVDELKSAYEGAPATGLNIHDHPLDDALLHPAIVARQRGPAALSATCLRCPVHRICGAGLYPHRYRPGTGFRNPSVYCTDLRALIQHIDDRVRADLRRLRKEQP